MPVGTGGRAKHNPEEIIKIHRCTPKSLNFREKHRLNIKNSLHFMPTSFKFPMGIF